MRNNRFIHLFAVTLLALAALVRELSWLVVAQALLVFALTDFIRSF